MAGLEDLYARGLISDDVLDRMTGRGDDAARTMTHQAEQPNPVRPIVDAARGYLQSGDFNPVHEPGTQPRDYLRELLRNPDILAKNIEQAGAFAGMANPTPRIAGNPAMIARINDGIARGLSRQAIADENGIGKATLGRYLDRSGQKTAAAENPSFWTPESEQQLIAWRAQGVPHPEIARRLGTTVYAVEGKVYALRDAGKLDFAPRWQPFVNDPKKTAEFVRDVNEGLSQGALSRKYGWDEKSGTASKRIHQLEERGDIKNYVPQGVTRGATPAGRTPTTAKTKTQARPITPEDLEFGQDFTKAMRAFLPSGP